MYNLPRHIAETKGFFAGKERRPYFWAQLHAFPQKSKRLCAATHSGKWGKKEAPETEGSIHHACGGDFEHILLQNSANLLLNLTFLNFNCFFFKATYTEPQAFSITTQILQAKYLMPALLWPTNLHYVTPNSNHLQSSSEVSNWIHDVKTELLLHLNKK